MEPARGGEPRATHARWNYLEPDQGSVLSVRNGLWTVCEFRTADADALLLSVALRFACVRTTASRCSPPRPLRRSGIELSQPQVQAHFIFLSPPPSRPAPLPRPARTRPPPFSRQQLGLPACPPAAPAGSAARPGALAGPQSPSARCPAPRSAWLRTEPRLPSPLHAPVPSSRCAE